MTAVVHDFAAEFARAYIDLRVRRLRRDDLQAARDLAIRSGYRSNDSDVARFCVAVIAEVSRSEPGDGLESALQRAVTRSRSVSGRRRFGYP